MKRLKILGLVVMAVMLLPNNAPAQAPDTLWTKTFGGSGTDYGLSVVQTSDGGYVLAGMTSSYGTGLYDVYLIKTDANGDTLWTKTYGGRNVDWVNSVAQTKDGGYIIAGGTYSSGAGLCDVYLIKTDADGNAVWMKTYGGSRDDYGYSVAQTKDGGYFIAGGTSSYGAGTPDSCNVYLIKTDASGNKIWTKTYGGSGDDWGNSVAQTSDGGYIIAGETYSYGAGADDVYLIKTDANGDTLWTKTYGGSSYDWGNSVAQTSDGGYIIVGFTASYGAGLGDVYLIKTNANGDTLWTKTYGGWDPDLGNSGAQTSDSGYIIAGGTYSHGAGGEDVYLIKTDANGDTLWTKTSGGNGEDFGQSVAVTKDGGYIIAGYTFSFGPGTPDSSNVYLIRLGPEKGVEENSNRKVGSANLRLGPNPFSKTTTISYQIPERSDISLTVYDITGQEIKRLVATVQEPGAYHLRLDMTGSPQGVYFIKLTAGKLQSVKKVIVLK